MCPMCPDDPSWAEPGSAGASPSQDGSAGASPSQERLSRSFALPRRLSRSFALPSPLGEKKGFATPAEFPLDGLADRLHFGGTNTLAVRVSSGDLAELGTGGLMKPVMIHRVGAAKAPDKKDTKGQGYEM